MRDAGEGLVPGYGRRSSGCGGVAWEVDLRRSSVIGGAPDYSLLRRGISCQRVSVSDDTASDLDLAQCCLEGDAAALAELRGDLAPWLRASLVSAGASPVEADDILGSLWTDCACATGGSPALLARYRGQCPLRGWLKVVTVNRLVDHQRRSSRLQHVARAAAGAATVLPEFSPEAPLIGIMKNAVTRALEECPAEALVMLQLVHIHGLTQRDLARLWSCHESKISRVLASASDSLSRRILANVREADPALTITWDDFVELCRCADFSVFV